MRSSTRLDAAIARMQERDQIAPDLQIVQMIHRQAVQARRDLADAYWARFTAFVRRQLLRRMTLGRATQAEACATSSTPVGGAACPR